MISNLNEINRVLLSVKELTRRIVRIRRTLLMEQLQGEVILGQNPDFAEVLESIEGMGLLSQTRRGFALTMFGSDIVSYNPREIYELQPRQRRLLMRRCYLDGAYRRHMKRLVKKFSAESAKGKIVWSAVDSEPLGGLEWLTEHLIQLGALTAANDTLIVTPLYKLAIWQFMNESADFTEAQFERVLRDKRLSGQIAEEYVLHFEQERLRRAGHIVEAACVQKISGLRTNAGYDINSFDGRSRSLAPDRFIEVKGSGKPTVHFIWSTNEMREAKERRGQYWIYFVGGVDRKNGRVKREPVLIQDPHTTLAADSRFQMTLHNQLVEANFSGVPLSPPYKS